MSISFMQICKTIITKTSTHGSKFKIIFSFYFEFTVQAFICSREPEFHHIFFLLTCFPPSNHSCTPYLASICWSNFLSNGSLDWCGYICTHTVVVGQVIQFARKTEKYLPFICWSIFQRIPHWSGS